MREIFIIGTIHNNFTNLFELFDILKELKPNQLLVEIANKDLKDNSFYYKHYPNEMVCAYDWAINNKIKVNGFDYDLNVVKNISKRKLDKISKKLIKKIKGYNWKQFNKKENNSLFDLELRKIIDYKKYNKREKMMLVNIYNTMIKNGKVVIVTGSGHLDFFEKNIKGVVFPLRK